MAKIFCLFCVIFFVACEQESVWEIREIKNPSGGNSGESFLYADERGDIYLSWIDLKDDSVSQLKFAKLEGESFTMPQTIAEGTDWFVNWADFPSIIKFPDSDKVLAHWLQKSDVGTYDYDVRISIGDDHGKQWSPSKVLHDDGVAAEHGFASLIPYQDKLIATWLDGRHMTQDPDKASGGHGHGSGAMTLRTAQIDRNNHISSRIELDNQVCECCQTDIAVTQDGPIVVYRNKTQDNIRDIYYTRGVDEDWTIPKSLYADNWKIAGCPVNGPRVDTKENKVAVAWYSGADQNVKAVYSNDNGKSFSEPIVINENETIGRVDVAYVDTEAFVVSYMIAKGEKADIKLAKVKHDNGNTKQITIGETSASRASGFPRLASWDNKIYVSYTYVDSTAQEVRTTRVSI